MEMVQKTQIEAASAGDCTCLVLNFATVITEQGFDDLIMKPWNLDELSARIRRLIARVSQGK